MSSNLLDNPMYRIDVLRWIEEASKDLEPLAREQITAQITEHYKDSVSSYRLNGLSEDDAHWKTLEDLGDPIKAYVGYERIYLKNGDINISHVGVFRGAFGFFALIFFSYLEPRMFSFVALYVMLGTSQIFTAKAKTASRYRALFYFYLLAATCFLTESVFSFLKYFKDFNITYILLSTVVMLFGAFTMVSKAIKLHRRARALSK